MDEILHHADEPAEHHTAALSDHTLPSAAPAPRERRRWSFAAAAMGAERFFREIPRHRYRWDVLRAEHPLLSALPFLGISIFIGALAILLNSYTICLSVQSNGVRLGNVQNLSTYQAAVAQVDTQVSAALGRDYVWTADSSPRLVLAQKSSVYSAGQMADAISDTIPQITRAWVLTLDGVPVGTAENQDTLDTALNAIRAQYTTKNTVSFTFGNQVGISAKYVSADADMMTADALISALNKTTSVSEYYEVRSGDTFAGIAESYGMTAEALAALNPGVSPTAIHLGQPIKVTRTVPVLSVFTVEKASYLQEVAPPVQEISDASLYVGQQKVVQPGSSGQAQVQAEVTYYQGVEQSRQVLSTQVITQPTARVVAVGTMKNPYPTATGTFQWPCRGSISSPFGYRHIFGSTTFHSGIDIDADYNDPISAADGGVVIFAGYQGSYGNMIIIKHGNGLETCYAHCCTLLASVGDTVSKGQLIARVGATGRATGSHCHFEVRVDGTAVNPTDYLP